MYSLRLNIYLQSSTDYSAVKEASKPQKLLHKFARISYTVLTLRRLVETSIFYAPTNKMNPRMEVVQPEVIRSRFHGFISQQQPTSNVLDDLDWPNEVGLKVKLKLKEHTNFDLVNRQWTSPLQKIKHHHTDDISSLLVLLLPDVFKKFHPKQHKLYTQRQQRKINYRYQFHHLILIYYNY